MLSEERPLNAKKTVLITGASRGIGYELAKIFASESFRLVLVSRNYIRLKEVQSELIRQYNSDVLTVAKDLSLPGASIDVYKELESRKTEINILVNNAGVGDFGVFNNEQFKKVSQMLHLNIVALTELTKLFLKSMVERKEGKILNIASLAAFLPGPYMAVYYASKAYVKSFSAALANELKGTGVSVTAVFPGLTKTGFQHEVGSENSNIAKLNLYSSSEYVAKFAYKALSDGKEVAIPGIINTSIAATTKILPDSLKTKIVKKIQELNRMHLFK